MSKLPQVTIWNEFVDERQNKASRKLYPKGMHSVIAKYLREHGFEVQTATQDQPDHGLSDDVLANTDVLIWWSHMGYDMVSDEVTDKVHKRIVNDGMGFIPLHSAQLSKIFIKLMGTSCELKWREIGEMERLWVVNPGHPIAKGIGDYVEIPHAEMFGEHFDIPQPDELVFVSWFAGGEVFRSGCCFFRGRGKIFYFRPGHETFPIFYHEEILKIIENAINWAAPSGGPNQNFGHFPKPIENIDARDKKVI